MLRIQFNLSDDESIEVENALKMCKLFPLKPMLIQSDHRKVKGSELVPLSTGRLPRELWLKYILPKCGALALLKLEKASKFFYYHINFMSCKDCNYTSLDPKLMTRDELEIRFIRSIHCKSFWRRLAVNENYKHPVFGGDLPCRIVKHLMAREQLKLAIPSVLSKLFSITCNRKIHLLTKEKKKITSKCIICGATVKVGVNQ